MMNGRRVGAWLERQWRNVHLIELGIVLLVLCDLIEELQALLDDVLLDDLQDLVLLEGLSGDVEWQILRIDDALDKAQVLWDELITVVHDEDSPHVQLDVVGLLPAIIWEPQILTLAPYICIGGN